MSNENRNSSNTSSSEKSGNEFRKRDVERALTAILKSEQFATSTQLSDFLSFIVTKTLKGEEADIKAYTIAVDALGKNADFDPQTNAAVRVAAGRLRQSLALYNADPSNANAALTISLEAGSYVPTFTPRSRQQEQEHVEENYDNTHSEHHDAAFVAQLEEQLVPENKMTMKASITELSNRLDTEPSLKEKRALRGWAAALLIALFSIGALLYWQQAVKTAATAAIAYVTGPSETEENERAIISNVRPKIKLTILSPDEPYPDWFKTRELSDAIVLAIARFDDFAFIGTRISKKPLLEDTREADYRFIVSAYRRGSLVRIYGTIIRERDGVVIWTIDRTFDQPKTPEQSNVAQIAGEIIAAIGSPYGVIYADLLSSGTQPKNLECVIAGYQYFNHKSDQGHLRARKCSEMLVEQNNRLPSVLAQLTFLYLDEYRENRNRRKRNPVKAAEATALKAIAAGPNSARAYQALFGVRKVQGNFEEARQAAERAISLNPYNTDIASDYAAWLISIGDFSKGRILLDRSNRLLGSHPAWVDVYRFLAQDLDGNTKRADIMAADLDPTRSPMAAMVVAISSARKGNFVKARQALKQIERVDPSMLQDAKGNLVKRGFAPGVADILSNRFREAQADSAQ